MEIGFEGDRCGLTKICVNGDRFDGVLVMG